MGVLRLSVVPTQIVELCPDCGPDRGGWNMGDRPSGRAGRGTGLPIRRGQCRGILRDSGENFGTLVLRLRGVSEKSDQCHAQPIRSLGGVNHGLRAILWRAFG